MDRNSHLDAGEAMSRVAALNTGLGIMMMAAFPFAVPILALTVACALPLLLLAVPLAIPVGLALIVRRIARRVSARRRGPRGASAARRLPPQPV
jgi:hypothetical protein